MKKLILLAFLPTITMAMPCLDLNGTWEGLCNRNGVTMQEAMRIRQDSCEHVNFYGIDYKIGRPYETFMDGNFERMLNIYNLYWTGNRDTLYFGIDRIRWMKDRSEVGTGEVKTVIKVVDNRMEYSRTSSTRSRQGAYSKSFQNCNFTRK